MHNIRDIFGSRKTEGVVGIEIEVEGNNLPQRSAGWNVVPDGSLRNGGLEYVTKGAVTLEKLKELLNNLKQLFEEHKSVVLDAHRGSVHIHKNVQEKLPEQIFTTLFLWLLVEPLWMNRSGPTRNGNLFCMSSGGSGEIIPYAKQLLARCRDGLWYNLWHRGKYSALNTDCLATFGSLEFRTFPSTIDPDRILRWAEWCDKLVEMGCALNPDKLYVVWQELLDNPRLFYGKVFDPEALGDLSDYELADFAEQGAEAASDMLFAWEEHKVLLKNPAPVDKKPRYQVLPIIFDDEDEEEAHVRDLDIDEDDDF